MANPNQPATYADLAAMFNSINNAVSFLHAVINEMLEDVNTLEQRLESVVRALSTPNNPNMMRNIYGAHGPDVPRNYPDLPLGGGVLALSQGWQAMQAENQNMMDDDPLAPPPPRP